VLEEVRLLQTDAVAILHLGNRFFSTALLGGKLEMLGKLPVEAAQRIHNIMQVALGFALRHTYVCSPPCFRVSRSCFGDVTALNYKDMCDVQYQSPCIKVFSVCMLYYYNAARFLVLHIHCHPTLSIAQKCSGANVSVSV
jgi:hypothetical protein